MADADDETDECSNEAIMDADVDIQSEEDNSVSQCRLLLSRLSCKPPPKLTVKARSYAFEEIEGMDGYFFLRPVDPSASSQDFDGNTSEDNYELEDDDIDDDTNDFINGNPVSNPCGSWTARRPPSPHPAAVASRPCPPCFRHYPWHRRRKWPKYYGHDSTSDSELSHRPQFWPRLTRLCGLTNRMGRRILDGQFRMLARLNDMHYDKHFSGFEYSHDVIETLQKAGY